MRMIHYFGALASLAIALLLAALWSGLVSPGRHLAFGLAGALTAIAAHSLLIVFFIVTGRILREACRARALNAGFLAQVNRFFEQRSAYPAALFAVLFTATAAVLGYGQRAFEFPAWVHASAGIFALVANMFSFTIELRALKENQRLMDRAAEELDRIDRELIHRVTQDDAEDGPTITDRLVQMGWSVMLGAWLPYAYQVVIVWKGQVSRVSLQPWIEFSAVGLAILILALRERAREPERG